MARKRILWLCSWYPDRIQPYNGDFVQRHARAASLYNDIHVIHVTGDPSMDKKNETLLSTQDNLTEQIIYFKKSGLFPRLINYRRWLINYEAAIKEYISKNGLPDLVHVHVPFRDGIMAMRLKKKYNLPYLVTEHWTIYQPQNKIRFESQSRLFRSMLSWIIRNSRLLLPVSENLGVLINKLVAEKGFKVVENVADTSLFYFKEKNTDNKRFRFIHVSTMNYQKNTEGLIKAFVDFNKENSNAELLLVGPLPGSIIQLLEATTLLNSKIFTTGEISYEQVAEEVRESHALLLFSRFENSPCSIIEAICCGLPVIATRVGGITEIINDSNGLLVEAEDEAALTIALKEMHTNYTKYNRKEIADAAAARFSYSVIGQKLDEIYSETIPAK
jgi:glycosyltransferase involved in cell wall biosynthesis